MELITAILLILLLQQQLFKAAARPVPPEVGLDYVLRAIEFLSAEHRGVFSCVFYDIGPRNPFANVAGELLKSPRLNHVVKYVAHGPYGERIGELPMNPTLLILYPGDDIRHLQATVWDVGKVLSSFNPTTKVLSLVDYSNWRVADAMVEFVRFWKFVYVVFLDVGRMHIDQYNGELHFYWKKMVKLEELFSYGRRLMDGRNITYFGNAHGVVPNWNMNWIREVARYLNAVAVHYQHDCKGSGQEFDKCMTKYRSMSDFVDIVFSHVVGSETVEPRNFHVLHTSIPLFVKILVPRERPYNTFELMLMPFTSNVWILLITILVSAEIAKRLFPALLKNDPIMLVVCGFERHILHRANRWEKTIFISLIILIFFMSHAFETKFISLIVSRPSIQRVKTLQDLYESGIKMYADLENSPQYRNHPVIGPLVVQGRKPLWNENIPGVALSFVSEWADLVLELSYDPIRMQPFYVPLDYLDFAACESYRMSPRSRLLEVFRRIHLSLVEAGLIDLWKRQYVNVARMSVHQDRATGYTDVRFKVVVDFDDMKVAWLVMGSGAGLGVLCFLVEITKKPFNKFLAWLKENRNQMCNDKKPATQKP